MPQEENLFLRQMREFEQNEMTRKKKKKRQDEKEKEDLLKKRKRDEVYARTPGAGLSASLFGEGYKEGYENGVAFAENAVDFLETAAEAETGNAFLGNYSVMASIFQSAGEPEKDEKDRELENSERFFKKETGKVPVIDLLKNVAAGESSGAFRKLYEKLKDADGPSQETEEALDDFLEEAEQQVLEEIKEEMERREEYDEKREEPDSFEEERREKFDDSMGQKLAILKRTMDSSRFDALMNRMDDVGYHVNPRALDLISMFGLRKKAVRVGLTKLEEIKSGQPAGFFSMLSGVKGFLGAEGRKLPEAEQNMEKKLQSFVLNDCAPTKRNVDQEAFYTSMHILGKVMPRRKFAEFVEKVNNQPGRGVRYKPEDFREAPKMKDPEMEAPEEAAPTLRPRMPWEE